MRYFTILIFTTLWVLNSYAQEFGTIGYHTHSPTILLRYYTGKSIILTKSL